METVLPPRLVAHAASVLVYDHHLAAPHQVVHPPALGHPRNAHHAPACCTLCRVRRASRSKPVWRRYGGPPFAAWCLKPPLGMRAGRHGCVCVCAVRVRVRGGGGAGKRGRGAHLTHSSLARTAAAT